MKKPWILILAIIIVLTLVGVWLYLFFGGEEAREDIFSTFGFGETLEGIDLPNFFDEETDQTAAILRQLSLKPIAGYTEVTTSSSSRTVRFVEAGTGHVFDLSVDTGTEVRISNITIPTADGAVFSNDGSTVAVTSAEEGKGIVLVNATSTETPPTSVSIAAEPEQLGFTDTNQLLYSTQTGAVTEGYVYAKDTGTSNKLFTLPFRDSKVLWANQVTGPHYSYPRTSNSLEGYLYQIKGPALSRLPIDGFGLSVIRDPGSDAIFLMRRYDTTHESLFYTSTAGFRTASIAALPEKCVFENDSALVCATAKTPYDESFPDTWYRGELISEDDLWFFDFENNVSHKVVSLGDSGRTIDAAFLKIGTNQQSVYFTNTIDRTLWIFDRDFRSPVTDNE